MSESANADKSPVEEEGAEKELEALFTSASIADDEEEGAPTAAVNQEEEASNSPPSPGVAPVFDYEFPETDQFERLERVRHSTCARIMSGGCISRC